MLYEYILFKFIVYSMCMFSKDVFVDVLGCQTVYIYVKYVQSTGVIQELMTMIPLNFILNNCVLLIY